MQNLRSRKNYFAGTMVRQMPGLLFLLALFAPTPQALGGMRQTESYKTHTHLAIPVDPGMSYEVERSGASSGAIGFKVQITGVFSQDTKTALQKLASLKDGRTESVTLQPGNRNGDWLLEVRFKNALGADYEIFDYRDQRTSTVFIDYWASLDRPEQKSLGGKTKNGGSKAGKTSSAKVSPRERGLASNTQGSGGNVVVKGTSAGPVTTSVEEARSGNLCGTRLDFAKDGVIDFKVYHRPFNYESHFALEFPDAKYTYPDAESLGKKTDENDANSDRVHYALTRKLYQEGRLGLALKTIEFYEKKFVKAEKTNAFLSEMKFLKVNALFKLSQKLNSKHFKESAHALLNLIMLNEPQTEKGQFARLFLLQDLIKNRKNVQALESALSGAELKDKYETVYLLAAAESMQAIGEKARAEALYQQIMGRDQKDRLAIEGAFRLGEVYMLSGDFEKARATFTASLRQYPERINEYPTAVFNHAECFFRLGRFSEAREMHAEFLKRFPHDDLVWASHLRVAEFNHTLQKTKADREAVIDGYEAVVNRAPYTTGAFLASVRLSDCMRIEGKDDVGRKNLAFYKNIFEKKDLSKVESNLFSPLDLRKFVDLYELRFKRRLGDYDYILKMARFYRSRLEAQPIHLSLKNELQSGVEAFILDLTKNPEATDSDYARALKLSALYKDYLPAKASLSFKLSMARALFETGDYKKAAEQLASLENEQATATPGVQDDIHWLNYEILRRTSTDFSAKQTALLRLNPEGAYRAERFFLNLELLAEQRKYREILDAAGDTAVAALPDDYKIRTFLLKMRAYRELNDLGELLKECDRFILSRGLEQDAQDFLPEVNRFRSEALYKLKKFDLAAEALTEVLAEMRKDETQKSNTSAVEFMLARSLDALGKEKEAEDAYRKLASTDKGMWGKSAKVELEQKQFKKINQKN